MTVPGFAPKRIYLENDASRPTPTGPPSTASESSKKGFLGVKWGFDNNVKR
jgi:hypothetical protein